MVTLQVHPPDVLREEVFASVLVRRTHAVYRAENALVISELQVLGKDVAFPFVFRSEDRLTTVGRKRASEGSVCLMASATYEFW